MTKWLYKLHGIKELLQEESTVEVTIKLCESLIRHLKVIQNDVEKKAFTDDDKDLIDNTLEVVISNFEFLRDLLNGAIPEGEWDDYEFELSDREELFNDYLEELYDLADERFQLKNNNIIKFMWVG